MGLGGALPRSPYLAAAIEMIRWSRCEFAHKSSARPAQMRSNWVMRNPTDRMSIRGLAKTALVFAPLASACSLFVDVDGLSSGGNAGVSGSGPADGGTVGNDSSANVGTDAGPSSDAGVDAASNGDGGDAGVDAGPEPSVLELVAGEESTCARLSGGLVKCWGKNDKGQLGLGDISSRGDGLGKMGSSLPTIDLGPGRTALKLAAGYSHTCAILDDGSVKCWGNNVGGQLGLGDTLNRGDGLSEMGSNLPTVNLGPGRTALQVTIGVLHTCARLDDGTVKCWGTNSVGVLGLGDITPRGGEAGQMGANLPTVNLGPGRTALELASGFAHVCARLDDGSVKCWGNNVYGQLGLGDTQTRGDGPGEMGANLPTVSLGSGRSAVQLTAGYAHNCARLDDGSAKCWGSNSSDELGLGDQQPRGGSPAQMGNNLPAINLGRTVLQLIAGSGASHTCARLDDGSLKCWGPQSAGELGLGDLQSRGGGPGQMGTNLPVVDLGLGRTARQVAVGGSHTCAALDDDSVKCWGGNEQGQLGLGDTQSRGDGAGEMGGSLPPVQLK
jgi:alpha-tubulin suppressor-like RCC1 family protein